MDQRYEYQDPDYYYTDPNSQILKNKFGITNRTELLEHESIYSTKRSLELLMKPYHINTADDLFRIHRHLF